MVTEFPVRFGQVYKLVLAILLPCLLMIPFIFIMTNFRSLEEWEVWVLIYSFLGIIIGLSLWLAIRSYPKALLCISHQEISLVFNRDNLLAPQDFSFNVADITAFKEGIIGTDSYYIFETKNPHRKFQVSAVSYEVEDMLDFNEAMVKISEMVNGG
jgi:hypothetical protein